MPSCAPEIKVELRHKSRDADSVVKKEETDEHPAASARIKTEVKVELQEGQEVKCEEVKCEEVKCEEPAPKKRAVMRRSKMDRELEGDVRSQVTLADIVARRETAKVTVSYTLSDAVDALVSTERTAAIVLDDGRVQGVLTENDVLAALVEGTSWQCQISEWLKGSYARLPGFMVPALTLPASASIADAAAEMTSLAEDGIGFTCHHMLVHTRDGAHGESLRILSALDIARGIIDTIAARTSRDSEAGPDPVVSVFTASDLTVEQAMKDRAGVPLGLHSKFGTSCQQAVSLSRIACLSYASIGVRIGEPHSQGYIISPDASKSASSSCAGLADSNLSPIAYTGIAMFLDKR